MGKLNGHTIIEARLNYIIFKAIKYNRVDWTAAASWYRNFINLDPLPWYLKTAFSIVNPNSTLNALTWSDKQVYLAQGFWRKNAAEQCGILLHETRHVLQYEDKRLTHFKYLTDSGLRAQLEREGHDFEEEWLRIVGYHA